MMPPIQASAGAGRTGRPRRHPAWVNPVSGSFVVGASVTLLAFNDLAAPLPLGELQYDAFIYAVPVLALCLLRHSGRLELPRALLHFAAIFGAVVLLGLAVNHADIARASFKGRSGYGRVITQSLTFGIGLFIAILFYNITLRKMVASIGRGARIALLIMAVVGALEVASWYEIPGLTQLHEGIGAFVHSAGLIQVHAGFRLELWPYPQRLRMTAFEVSWAAVMLTFFFPFALVNIGPRKNAPSAYAALVLVMVLLTQSRTALLVCWFQLLMLGWYHGRRRLDVVFPAVAVGCVGVMLFAADAWLYRQAEGTMTNVIEYGRVNPDTEADTNISNVTRAAGIMAAQAMFMERPLFGVGLGQYGFHYPTHLRRDDFRSYEVRELVDNANDYWPPVYSMHARLLAETGIVGYLVWLLFILKLLGRSMRCAVRTEADPEIARPHLAVAMTMCGLLALGASIDSFRFFGGWIAMGIALGLPEHLPRRAAALARRPPPSGLVTVDGDVAASPPARR